MGEFNLDNLNKRLAEILQRAQNAEPALREIGVLMAQEMKTNIAEGGRPTKWEPSQRVKRKGGQTLRDSGTLVSSMTSEATSTSVAAGPTAVGRNHLTDPRIMAILAFGGTITRHARSELFLRRRVSRGKTKGRFAKGTFPASGIGGRRHGHTLGEYTITIPARDYTYIPPEAQGEAANILRNFVLGE